MLYIVEKALDELESVPTEKREGLKHLDQEMRSRSLKSCRKS